MPADENPAGEPPAGETPAGETPAARGVDRDVGYLVDMMENAKIAMRRVVGVDWDRFSTDDGLQDMVVRRLAIVGEAARLVSASTRDLLPDIPWRQINSMRNILIHDYKGVEFTHVWDVVQNHAPELVRVIQAYLDSKQIRP